LDEIQNFINLNRSSLRVLIAAPEPAYSGPPRDHYFWPILTGDCVEAVLYRISATGTSSSGSNGDWGSCLEQWPLQTGSTVLESW